MIIGIGFFGALLLGTVWLVWKCIQGVCYLLYYGFLAAPYVAAALVIAIAYTAVLVAGGCYLGYLSLTEEGRSKIKDEVWPRLKGICVKIPEIMPEKPQAFYSDRR